MSVSPKIFIISASMSILALIAAQNSQAQDYDVIAAPFNSKQADFSGVFNGKDIIFSSTRAKKNLSFDDDSLTLYYTDLYQARMKGDGSYDGVDPIRGNVNSELNEGHACFNAAGTSMYFTSNLKISEDNDGKSGDEYKLGIFMADLIGDEWIITGEFLYNSPDGKFSIAHPSISANDSTLYFCSDMPGGMGKSDLYRCDLENGSWSAPKNLGSKVNTKGNEFFPFINEFNILYFSTDARNDSKGMDIYASNIVAGEFQKPERLAGSINTESDEFAYQERNGINHGCFSSNRNGEDDLFLFTKYVEGFDNCHENYKLEFCYHFYDRSLVRTDSLPLAYEWHMGDGTVVQGQSIDYCYKNFGQYHIVLNVVDTTTKMVFRKVSETDVSIRRQNRPFIHCHDTIYSGVSFECKLELIDFDDFEIEEVEWDAGEDIRFSGEAFTYTFRNTGKRQLKCRIIGKPRPDGIKPHLCLFKNIECITPDAFTALPKPLLCCDNDEYFRVSLDDIAESATSAGENTEIFKIVIARSKEPLAIDNAIFKKVFREITELKTADGYEYAIAEAATWQELIPMFDELKKAGVGEVFAENYLPQELSSAVVKVPERLASRDTKTAGKKSEATKQLAKQQVKNLYCIILDETKDRRPFTDPVFSKVTVEISELRSSIGYEYAIMAVPQWHELEPLLEEVRGNGFKNAHIDSLSREDIARRLVKTGRYAAPGDANNLNIEFSRLRDIKFEYNSAIISEESYRNLNYIAAMLSLEEDFSVKIYAYTCNMGSAESNMRLSDSRAQSVVEYLVRKGIARERLKPVGYGQEKPIESNSNEEGRAANRRVEFTIVFEHKNTSNE